MTMNKKTRVVGIVLAVALEAIAVVFLTITVVKSGGSPDGTGMVSGDVISQVNNVRTGKGLKALTVNERLEHSAEARAYDMCDQGYFGHESPDKRHTAEFVTEAGYEYQWAGENLAHGFTSTEDAVAGWVASTTHYRNIVKPEYTETGVAIIECEGYQGLPKSTIIVQHFGQPKTVEPSPAPETVRHDVQVWTPTNVLFGTLALALIFAGTYFISVNATKHNKDR